MIYYYKLKIILPLVHYLVSLLTNDKGIMDEALELGILNKEELYLFNLERIHYKVIFLSDLTNRAISYITYQFLEEKELPCPRECKWPLVVLSKKLFKLLYQFL